MTLPSVDELTVWYKYVATMTFVKRSYQHFKHSIYEKKYLFLNAKAQIHVVPFYFHPTGIYYQPIFDFDKCNNKLEILAFIDTILCTNGIKENQCFIELSPHGIHVGCKYAFGPISIDDIRKIRNYARETFSNKFKHLDVVSSIRLMAISRTPSYLKNKRMFALEVSKFKRSNLKGLRKLQDDLKIITSSIFEDQVKHYLFLKGIKIIDEAPKYVLDALTRG